MEEAIIDGINYRLDEENLTAEVIKKGEGYEGDITIPETVVFNERTYRVTSIGKWAFKGCSSLTSIVIPDGVTSIGKSAFWNCESLTSISIPNSVTCIEDTAFHRCKKLPTITIPDSVEIIGDSAFWGCESLKVIAIPNSVKVIGDSAFANCTSLSSITFLGAAPWMKGIGLGDGWHFGSPAKIVIIPMEM